jgi:hypothetical protein
VHEGRREWPELVAVTTRLLEGEPLRLFRRCRTLRRRARAWLELGEYGNAEADLVAVEALGSERHPPEWVFYRLVKEMRREISARVG